MKVTDVTICEYFVFDAVGPLYVVIIVARFYTVQYKHMKQDVVCCICVCFKPLEYVFGKNWQNWITSD